MHGKFTWVCRMYYQVAEKKVKALVYNQLSPAPAKKVSGESMCRFTFFFFASTLIGGEWSVYAPAALSPGKIAPSTQ
jgi:hypothetical protein